MTVIATAGHVDHGKSTLVLRLTGTDPDRWDEEKTRGLTIDLGFASLGLPSGRELSFIDVPGHIRFIRNMLAGVGAVDACLFVVAATEGWKPQTEEHLRILSLLGIERGVVALTKIDQVDDDLYALAELDVEEHVAGTFLEGAPVLGVSATEGLGIDELQAALDQLVAEIPARDTTATPRLWVDRAFAPAGAGTVVTGTIVGGTLRAGDELTIVPGDKVARVRSLQSHHRQTEAIEAGNRAAVNLTGVSHNDLGRGHVLVEAGAWHHTAMIDAELSVLESLDHPVSRRGAYVAYIGSGEFPVRVRVLGPSELQPGGSGAIRLYLAVEVPLLPGDRFVLRESGRDETVGGGQILDVEPVLPAATARPDRSIDRVVAERGWVDVDHLRRLTGAEVPATVGRWVVADEALAATVDEVRRRIDDAGPLGLDLAALDDRERSVVDLIDDASVEAGRATIGEAPDPLAGHPWVAALEASPFNPPGIEGIDRAEVRELVRRGTVVESDGVYFGAGAIAEAARRMARLLADQPEGFTVAEARDTLGTTRKYVLPLLAHLDQTGVTRRRDDLRIAGPRLPAAE
ncbi:MAG: selenocysteine-specific translation elongation factor [Acidimicrobiia bacterium]|nr:selenocysteine-specific translation elongation factor [Acidimicrobiia bacterium]